MNQKFIKPLWKWKSIYFSLPHSCKRRSYFSVTCQVMKLNLFVSISGAGEQAVASPSRKEQCESYVLSPFTVHGSRPPWVLQLALLGPKFFSNFVFVSMHAHVCPCVCTLHMHVCLYVYLCMCLCHLVICRIWSITWVPLGAFSRGWSKISLTFSQRPCTWSHARKESSWWTVVVTSLIFGTLDPFLFLFLFLFKTQLETENSN